MCIQEYVFRPSCLLDIVFDLLEEAGGGAEKI